MYTLLADIVAGLHLGYVLAVVVGLALILLGGLLRWRWVGNRWFRSLHLAMIVGVVIRALIWRECPLTWWERDLRTLAGQIDYEGSPIGWALHMAIHPNELSFRVPVYAFLAAYATFAVLVVAALWLVPVRWRGDSPAAPVAAEEQDAQESLAGAPN